jgi:hypothetical protein
LAVGVAGGRADAVLLGVNVLGFRHWWMGTLCYAYGDAVAERKDAKILAIERCLAGLEGSRSSEHKGC